MNFHVTNARFITLNTVFGITGRPFIQLKGVSSKLPPNKESLDEHSRLILSSSNHVNARPVRVGIKMNAILQNVASL